MFPVTLKPFIWVDYSIIVLITVTSSIGTVRGFSREVIVLFCWVSGFWVSLHFSATISNALQSFVSAPIRRFVITFIGLLVSTVLFNSFLQQWFTTRVKQTYHHTAFMEHLGGLICGTIQGFLITTIVVFLTEFSKLPTQAWWQESSLLPFFQILAIWLRDHVATQMANVIYR